ncbi:MAG: phosphoribosylformylglycinamidine synthase [Clostridia bacterium]|nr:phosphoribosylformylglycinamidine synthase [Clostridia bacterium]
MVYRIYVEKKPGFDNEARSLAGELRELLGISGVRSVRQINRYDCEGISKELFDYCVRTVFSEPQIDYATAEVDLSGARVLASEFLPGQFDQRADSAAQCIQLISRGDRPAVRSAKIYAIYGDISDSEFAEITKFLINPVESREASLDTFDTLRAEYPVPADVKILEGFTTLDRAGLEAFVSDYALAMDIDDITFCQKYFKTEGRDPSITEIRMIDTYWSDHCRHTTFLTEIDSVTFEDELLQKAYDNYIGIRKELGRTKPVSLMDIGTLAAKYLKKTGQLRNLDESEEINACTVKIKVTVDGEEQDWLLLFKNETHNHPTEIEPFGGAATCIGGAIRDPLSGRSYVYAAMRVTGAADPTKPISETIKGKLPQRQIVTGAATGYSSYGNQIGLATGLVNEIYHPGYAAKRMEIGAVIAAAPADCVRRECPLPGDYVILLGGRTGRDGCGGATGSSKSHTATSLADCGAEVQKGNAPEERKLQRLFRNAEASRLIKRCNDFGAGGVSVAIGELADGLTINLDKVPKKYEGLDGTELAISESQERMAVVVAASDAARFIEIATAENLEATHVATVTEEPRLTMFWRGKQIVDLSREFLNSNGAEKHIDIKVPAIDKEALDKVSIFDSSLSFTENYVALASDLNCCSGRGLSERFDSTIGAGTVMMPFGGKNQLSPIQTMVHKISVEKGHTDDVSLMSWGYNPFLSEASPYHGAYMAVVESICRLVASGAKYEDVYLTFQEYFKKPGHDGERWGQPMAALLGAFAAQTALGSAAIGGKDSMSGSAQDLDVPPTLVSFAVTTDKVENMISSEFKTAGNKVLLLKPKYDENGLPVTESLLSIFSAVTAAQRAGDCVTAFTPGIGGVAEALMKMGFGNNIGVDLNENVAISDIFNLAGGSFILEVKPEANVAVENFDLVELGTLNAEGIITLGGESVALAELLKVSEDKLESVYACNITPPERKIETVSCAPKAYPAHAPIAVTRPKVLIPVFPGTNCEFDTAKAFADAGADPEIFVIANLSAETVARSVEEFAKKARESQIIFIPGGFSGGDEPDGSGKFITAFFRNGEVKDAVTDLLDNRAGLMGGICNGFQALIKLGLVPYGKIIDTDENCPTLTYNDISRHQSKIVRVRVASNSSPWLSACQVGDVYSVPISHGEGRFVASDELLAQLAANSQIMTQYVDACGNATGDIRFNPNGSANAVEGILSPDGRVFGKMGHSERKGHGLYLNVPGEYDMKLFESAVKYFKA